MAWQRKQVATPVKDCLHKMHFELGPRPTQCWCTLCGQTWGWTTQHRDDFGNLQGGGWFVQPIRAVKFGEYVEDEF